MGHPRQKQMTNFVRDDMRQQDAHIAVIRACEVLHLFEEDLSGGRRNAMPITDEDRPAYASALVTIRTAMLGAVSVHSAPTPTAAKIRTTSSWDFLNMATGTPASSFICRRMAGSCPGSAASATLATAIITAEISDHFMAPLKDGAGGRVLSERLGFD
jgi:hypothetical protein